MAPERPGLEDDRCGSSVLLHANGVTVPIVRQPLTLTSDLLKEGDGAVKVFTEVRVGSATTEDDDLTPLSWLQDRNLLKGIALRAGPMCPEGSGGGGEARRRVAVEEVAARMGSPTSDYADDSSEQADSSSNSGAPASPPVPTAAHHSSPELPTQNSHSTIIPYNPKVHVTSKPPYSFSCLIFMAIEDCTQRALPVKDIYAWILDHFPYFQTAPTGWKNSVRHNLSLNKCFKKVDKSPNVGKGSLWMVDPVYRPNLLQALRKAPFHPYMQAERLSASSGASPVTPSSTISVASASSSNNSNSSEYSVPVLLTAATPSTPGRSNLPNPTLFPFLSRRLAAAGLGLPSPQSVITSTAISRNHDDEDSDSREDVDAATAMLALKHGPRILLPRRDEWYKRLRDEGTGSVPALDESRTPKPRHRATLVGQQVIGKSLVITSSPSEDHTYAGPTGSSPTNNGTRVASSPDEAFGEGSASSAESSHDKEEEEEEEQRKIAEGADALLNLAGICTLARGTKRSAPPPAPRINTNKRQRLVPDKRQQPMPPRTWKKASLHQGSRVHKGKSKEKSSRHRR